MSVGKNTQLLRAGPWHRDATSALGQVLRAALVVTCGVSQMSAVAANEPASTDIPTITVRDRAAVKHRQTLDYLKLPINARESPLALETIDGALVGSGGYNDLGALLDVASSALTAAAEGGSANDISLRGFSNTPLFRNGLNGSLIDAPPVSAFNIERVEILKGPDAALFGPGEAGGAINIVTKQPSRNAARSFVVEIGSPGARNFSLDATGPAAGSSALLYRLIAAREQGDTFRDFIQQDRWFVAPSLAWQVTPSTEVVTSIELTREQGLHDTGIVVAPGLRPLPPARFLGEPAVGAADVQSFISQTTATLALLRQWTLELQLQGQYGSLDGMGVEPDGIDHQGRLARELTASDNSGEAWVAQLEVAGSTMLWGQAHHLVFGLEATRLQETANLFISDVDDEPFTLDTSAPRYGQALPALLPERRSVDRRRQLSAYGQDLWKLSEHWQVLGAVRLDHLRQRGVEVLSGQRFASAETATSPRISLVHTSAIGLTWYGTYSHAIEPNEGLQPNRQPLAPTTVKALESGLRYTPSSRRFTLDGALFGIRQRDGTTPAPGAPGFELQNARQRSIGADVELRVLPVHAVSLTLQYHWLDTALGGDPLLPKGTAALNAPRHQAGVVALYEPRTTRYGPLVLGLAARYVGQRSASLDVEELHLRLADYTRIDLFARWQPTHHITAQLRIENVLDDAYIRGSDGDARHLEPGAPLAVYGELRLSF